MVFILLPGSDIATIGARVLYVILEKMANAFASGEDAAVFLKYNILT